MKIDYDTPCEAVSEIHRVVQRLIEKNIGMGELARKLDMDVCQLVEFLGGRMPIGPAISGKLKKILQLPIK